MRFLGRSLTGLFLLAVTFGLLAMGGKTIFDAVQVRMGQESFQRPARERVLAVNTMVVEQTDIAPVLTSFGEVRSRRTLDLRASAGGALIELAEGFEEGGRVEAGQLLARIDPVDAQSALDVAQTDLAEARAGLAEAERALILAQDDLASAEEQEALRAAALERANELRDRGAGTSAAVETAELAASSSKQAVLSRRQAMANAESAVDRARTTLSRAGINLAEAERNLTDTEIYADFSGTLTEVTAVVGGLVTNNERIARIIDTEALEVSFRVSTAQYARLLDENGQLLLTDVSITLDTMGVDLQTTGRITRESASVGDGQTGRVLFARIDAPKGFRPGDFVAVNITEPMLTRVAVIPAAAVGADSSVLVVGEDERLSAMPVELLRRQGEEVIVRARGLGGLTIVTERSPALGEGIRVRPSTPRAPPTGGAPQANARAGGDNRAGGFGGGEMIALDADRRARLIAFVESNNRMPAEIRDQMLEQLKADEVPAQMVERLESRMGG